MLSYFLYTFLSIKICVFCQLFGGTLAHIENRCHKSLHSNKYLVSIELTFSSLGEVLRAEKNHVSDVCKVKSICPSYWNIYCTNCPECLLRGGLQMAVNKD